VATQPGVLIVMRLIAQKSAPTHNSSRSSLSAVAVEETTQPTTGAVRNKEAKAVLAKRAPVEHRKVVPVLLAMK